MSGQEYGKKPCFQKQPGSQVGEKRFCMLSTAEKKQYPKVKSKNLAILEHNPSY